jgi:hypothetical protein
MNHANCYSAERLGKVAGASGLLPAMQQRRCGATNAVLLSAQRSCASDTASRRRAPARVDRAVAIAGEWPLNA